MARIFDVIPAKAGIQKKIFLSHPEFISGSINEMLKQVQHDKKSLDSRLRGNDIRHFFRAAQQHKYKSRHDTILLNRILK
ncbi:hypothetical protein [Rickettsia endosymbiont of Polydrusus tereticollis]|uniref:hypothetical protein n=1 Tax=Rickettsia endosymbiont of Polydrusus tereticollis TaxID=3066251 RepID=UPI003132E9D0